ncbi:DUF2388 domain-containing protein [Pseudomonas taetrolens]|uniref:DUF2388 domain-containing protein n=1 Tax=Pseudomonas taetrolens TaxID=47884 RepID=UPI003F9DD6B1
MYKVFAVIASFHVFLLFSGSAMAINKFWLETVFSSTTVGTSYLSSRDNKQVLAVQDDATSFVASDGELQGPYLLASLKQYRAAHPESTVSDRELAIQILLVNCCE